MNDYEKALEAKNLTEHLRITRENIAGINHEINTKTQEKNDLIKEIESLKEEAKEIERLDNESIERSNAIYQDAAQKKLDAENKLKEADKILKEAIEKSQILLNESNKAAAQSNHQLELSEEQKQVLEKAINYLQAEIDSKTESLGKIHSEIATAGSDLLNLRESYNKLQTLKEEEEQKLERHTQEVIDEIVNLRKLVLIEAEKVKVPREQLEFEKDQFDRKMKNFLILKNRFEDQYKKAFPELEIKL